MTQSLRFKRNFSIGYLKNKYIHVYTTKDHLKEVQVSTQYVPIKTICLLNTLEAF